MTTSRTLRALLALGSLALVAATCDSLGPAGPEAGTYAAVSVDGQPLPYTYYQDDDELIRLHADTLVLDGRGKAIRSMRIENVWQGQVQPGPPPIEMQYRVDGETFTIGHLGPCGPLALCAAPETGTLRNGEIVLLPSGARQRRYVRGSP